MPTFFPGTDVPVAQWRIGGDAGAEQRSDGGEVEVGRDGVGEAFVDDIVVRVSAHGDGAVDAILGGVGERGAFGAEMLFAAIAGLAVAAGIDDDADGSKVSDLELFGRVSCSDDPADDLVAGNHGIDCIAPLVAGHVQVRVADSAVENFDTISVGPGSRRLKLYGASGDLVS